MSIKSMLSMKLLAQRNHCLPLTITSQYVKEPKLEQKLELFFQTSIPQYMKEATVFKNEPSVMRTNSLHFPILS